MQQREKSLTAKGATRHADEQSRPPRQGHAAFAQLCPRCKSFAVMFNCLMTQVLFGKENGEPSSDGLC